LVGKEIELSHHGLSPFIIFEFKILLEENSNKPLEPNKEKPISAPKNNKIVKFFILRPTKNA